MSVNVKESTTWLDSWRCSLPLIPKKVVSPTTVGGEQDDLAKEVLIESQQEETTQRAPIKYMHLQQHIHNPTIRKE